MTPAERGQRIIERLKDIIKEQAYQIVALSVELEAARLPAPEQKDN